MFPFGSLHAWIAVLVTLIVFVAIQLRRGTPPDLLFVLGLVAVTLSGVITPEQALVGFANTAIITIAGLFVVAAGLRATGVLDVVGHWLLGSAASEGSALRRLSAVIVATSAFVLNTPLVAMFMPVVIDWCRQRNVSPSRLLMPLSYLAILGGVCTLIGTSTTLVVNGMLRAEYEQRVAAADAMFEDSPRNTDEIARRRAFAKATDAMGFFEISRVGIPCAIAGTLVLMFLGPRLLPSRGDLINQLGEQRREYLVEMLVQPHCRLVGQTVEAAGLRHLHGLFLIEIDRDGDIITPVTPQDLVHAGDRLVFTGVVSTIVELEKIAGLVPAADISYEIHPQKRQQRHLTEVVLSRTSPLIGTTVKEANFRQLYNAAVVAVHRSGVRLTNKIGSIVLEPGDTLLLQTRSEFVPAHRNNRDFYLVSSVEGSEPRRHDRAWLAGILALLLIVWLGAGSLLGKFDLGIPAGLVSPAVAAVAIAAVMVVARCVSMSDARNAIDLQIVLTIGAALGLGRALTESGAAANIAAALVGGVQSVVTDDALRPYLLLAVLYLAALVFTEMISNAAVAAMLIPLAVAVAWEGGYNPRPFIMAITIAASLSFLTPVGYQTNLMVMGPGGYRPADYLRVGVPLAAVVAVTAISLIPWIWPFAFSP